MLSPWRRGERSSARACSGGDTASYTSRLVRRSTCATSAIASLRDSPACLARSATSAASSASVVGAHGPHARVAPADDDGDLAAHARRRPTSRARRAGRGGPPRTSWSARGTRPPAGRHRTPLPSRPARRRAGAAPRRTPACAGRRPARPAGGAAPPPCAAGSPRTRTGPPAGRDSASAVSTATGPGTAVTRTPGVDRRRAPAGSRGRTPSASRRRVTSTTRAPPSSASTSSRGALRSRCARSTTRPARPGPDPEGGAPAGAAAGCPRRPRRRRRPELGGQPRRGVARVADRGRREHQHAAARSRQHGAPVARRASLAAGTCRCLPWRGERDAGRRTTGRRPDGRSRTSRRLTRRDSRSRRGRPSDRLPLRERLAPADAAGRLVGLGRSADGDGVRRGHAVLEPRPAAGVLVRRDVLRQGRAVAVAVPLRAELGRQRQRHDPGRQHRTCSPARPPFIVHPPVGKWVDRARRALLRGDAVRLAVHAGRARHADGADAVPDRAADDPVDAARVPGRAAAGGRRAVDRAVAAPRCSTARSAFFVLAAFGVLVIDRDRARLRLADWAVERRRARADVAAREPARCSAGGRCGCPPASCSAWPAPPSGAGCGSSSRSG